MAIVWTFGSFDFIAQGAVPASLDFQFAWRTQPLVIPGRAGVVAIEAPDRDGLRFSIAGFIVGASATELRTTEDLLRAELAAGIANFYVHDDRYLEAIPEGLRWEVMPVPGLRAARFAIDFLAPEGLWIADSASSDTGTASWSPTLTNSGNAPAPPTITFTAPGGGLTQAVMTLGTQTLTWDGSLAAAETLVIDMGEKTITAGGVDDPAGFAAGSEFWSLAAGSNSPSFTSTPTGATVLVEWRDRWF